MSKKLFFQAIFKFAMGVLLVGALLFLSAGTLHYPAAWLLMGILFIPMFIAGLVMMLKSPALLRERLDAKEKQSDQDLAVKFSGLMFVTGFVAAGLDFRFGWTHLPVWVSIVFSLVFLLAYLLYALVLRENAYLSRTIKVQEGQKVIDTGLYGIVRHPMYSATLLLFLSMPLVLRSLPALLIFLVYPFILVKRLRSEEKLLEKELPGYAAYMQKVKYRLIPFVW